MSEPTSWKLAALTLACAVACLLVGLALVQVLDLRRWAFVPPALYALAICMRLWRDRKRGAGRAELRETFFRSLPFLGFSVAIFFEKQLGQGFSIVLLVVAAILMFFEALIVPRKGPCER